jgi:hypothetical protein
MVLQFQSNTKQGFEEERPTVFLGSVRRLLVTASVVPSSPILVTLMKEALHGVTSRKPLFFEVHKVSCQLQSIRHKFTASQHCNYTDWATVAALYPIILLSSSKAKAFAFSKYLFLRYLSLWVLWVEGNNHPRPCILSVHLQVYVHLNPRVIYKVKFFLKNMWHNQYWSWQFYNSRISIWSPELRTRFSLWAGGSGVNPRVKFSNVWFAMTWMLL